MGKEYTIRITQIAQWSWARRFMTIFGIFVGTWGLLEPLFAVFDGPIPLAFLGLWRYVCFVIFAVITGALVEFFERQRSLGRLSFIKFTILLMESGTRYLVEAPEDMRAEEFLELFIQKVTRSTSAGSSLARSDIYVNSLIIFTGDEAYKELDPLRSLKENGIGNESIYKIHGRIKDNHESIFYGPLPIIGNDETGKP